MTRIPFRFALAAMPALLLAGSLPGRNQAPPTGRVVDSRGEPAAGVFITVSTPGSPVSHSVLTDDDGRFDLAGITTGQYLVQARGNGFRATQASQVSLSDRTQLPTIIVGRAPTPLADLSASAFLGLLPENDEKRRFILDCTGCHVFDARFAAPADTARSAANWQDAVTRMLGFSGPASNFPVISQGRDPAATATYLAGHVRLDRLRNLAPIHLPRENASTALITEYAVPEPGDLPHDLAVLADGSIAITGMFTHGMYVLSPATGAMPLEPIPVPNANPRAVEVDAAGNWWVLLGGPRRVAKRDAAGAWTTWPIGMYGHSVGLDARGRACFNGHFTREPELLGHVEPATGRVVLDTVPAHPRAASGFGPIPYELRVAPTGEVWVSELAGNRVFSHDPASDRYRMYEMPSPHSGPRRLDVGPDGSIWIPEYSGNRLARLDPATGRFGEFELPVPDALPYVVRIDARRGRIWIGTGAADAIFLFDPASRRFTTYPLPTRGALVRHLDVDDSNGDLWIAYGASPGVPAKVARLRLRR